MNTSVNNNIIIILTQTLVIEQGLRRLLNYGARKPKQTWKDLLIIVDAETSDFFHDTFVSNSQLFELHKF